MRKIEKLMIEAIKNKTNWSLDNTIVQYCSVADTSAVFLYSNHIGTFMHLYKGFRTDLVTLSRWHSPTTKSRLRALGVNVYTKKGVTYLNDKAVN
jgi:hypothetical protein